MKGHIMNYIQSFKPNGLANANGSIRFYSRYEFSLYRFDFENNGWEIFYSNFIKLDENGVSNELWKLVLASYAKPIDVSIRIYDQGQNEIFNYKNLSDWNDAEFSAMLNYFNEELNALIAKAKPTKIYASRADTASFNDVRNYVMVINDTNKDFAIEAKILNGKKKEIVLEPTLMLVGYIDSQGVFYEL